MIHRNKLGILALSFMLIFVLAISAGCSKGAPEGGAADPGSDTGAKKSISDLTIGACVMSLQHEFMINEVEGYKEFVKQTGLDLIITDGGNMEPEKQVENVENFIEQSVDGIIINVVNTGSMEDILNQAFDAGIKTCYYPQVDEIRSTCYLLYDEYDWGSKLGAEAVKWIKEKLDGKATVISLESSLEMNSKLRGTAWKDVLTKELGDDVNIISVEATASEDAMSTAESALQANPEAQMLLTYNDEMGVGAYQAVVQSGLDTSKFFVGSVDGTDTVLDIIEQDTPYRCSIGSKVTPVEFGFGWLQNLTKACLGMEFIEAYPMENMPITIENVKEYRSKENVFELDADLKEYIEAN